MLRSGLIRLSGVRRALSLSSRSCASSGVAGTVHYRPITAISIAGDGCAIVIDPRGVSNVATACSSSLSQHNNHICIARAPSRRVNSKNNILCRTFSSNSGTTHSSNQTKPTKVHLPTFGQNGTLILHSDSNSVADVKIVPGWRDDAMLELLPLNDTSERACEAVTDDISTDISERGDGHGSDEIATFDCEQLPLSANGNDQSSTMTTQTFGALQLKSHKDGTSTSLGRKGTLIEANILMSGGGATDKQFQIIVTVPEKSNITCQIVNGNIDIDGKLEGDTHLATAHGNITVSKLRGHNVTLDTTTKNADTGSSNSSVGVIHVRKAIEARSIQIKTASRVRARMLNGSDVSVHVVSDGFNMSCNGELGSSNKLDDDDEGALIDVGSLYVSSGGGATMDENEARLFVDCSSNNFDTTMDGKEESMGGGLIRVKSSHGHVAVHAKTNRSIKEMQQPLIDLGGVNGSCDVTLDASSSSTTSQNIPDDNTAKESIATRIHFDSLTPESISTITSHGQAGEASITIDRKLEADIRLLAAPVFPLHMDAHSLTSEEVEDVRESLMKIKGANGKMIYMEEDQQYGSSISIETDAYSANEGASLSEHDQEKLLSHGIQYQFGTVMNRSGEPDSRFDRRSRGKINVDSAASQALHGFQGKQTKDTASVGDETDNNRPLLAVATDGKIKLETLSWFGSIARRYGLEEEEGSGRDVGRQASRKPRLDEK